MFTCTQIWSHQEAHKFTQSHYITVAMFTHMLTGFFFQIFSHLYKITCTTKSLTQYSDIYENAFT